MALHALAVRVNHSNPNHHLWNNNGTWFLHYVVHHPDGSKERFRDSLGTKSLHEARIRRDTFFETHVASPEQATMIHDIVSISAEDSLTRQGWHHHG